MTRHSAFVAVDFSDDGPEHQATIYWAERSSIYAAFRRPLGSTVIAVERRWSPKPADAEKTQTALAEMLDGEASSEPGYRLVLQAPGQPRRVVTWSAQQESEKLRAVRELLEEVSHLLCLQAMGYLEAGRYLQQGGDLVGAMDTLRAGVDVLGARYEHPDFADSTGMKLVLAEHDRNSGKLEEAATLFDRVLESRILQYLQANG